MPENEEVEQKSPAAKRYEEIKAGLLDPEHQTQEWWHRAVSEMLGLAKVPKGHEARVKRIARMVEAASRKRDPIPQGRGFWFASMIELMDMVNPPDGCEAPSEEELAAAGENDEIRAERANRISEAQRAESARMGLEMTAPAGPTEREQNLAAENEDLKQRLAALEAKLLN